LYPATPIGARAAADGLALSGGGFRFLNSEVEAFYEALSGWLELWTPVRERVRSAEKRALAMVPPRDPDGLLVRTRVDLDRLAHEVARSLLDAAKSSDWATAVDRAAGRARADLAAVAAGTDYRQACALADEIGRPEAGVDGWR
ncbi:MAG: hypothetical protein K6U08_09995, partial [Firmicutes bacterium]|nr:hypothetical protein [Bacillota bacterium]